MWFQVLFAPLAGVLFTFPSRYLFTIGGQIVFSLGRWSSRIPTGLHVSRGTQVRPPSPSPFRLPGYHRLWPAFQSVRLEIGFVTRRRCWRTHAGRPTTPSQLSRQAWHWFGLGCSPFARRYWGNLSLISFPAGTEMFQFPAFTSLSRCQVLPWSGFPIRKSPDRSLIGGSPRLIAAIHVLHRLLSPRHPPHALNSLTNNFHIAVERVEFRIRCERFLPLARASRRCRAFLAFFDCQRTAKNKLVMQAWWS